MRHPPRLALLGFVAASFLALFSITLSQSKFLLNSTLEGGTKLDSQISFEALGLSQLLDPTMPKRLVSHVSSNNSRRGAPLDLRESLSKSPYAYAFVIGGCNPQKPTYRGYIYNILVSAHLLRQLGSNADVVAMIQLSNQIPDTELPEEDTRPLQEAGVKIKYLSKDEIDDFYGIQMRKFDILNLTEYRRVIHMDGDVMPVGNMDYFFELSDGPNAVLKDNVVVSGVKEPANGGFFMLTPGKERFESLKETIRRREETPMENLMYGGKIQFDIVKGWGHTIQVPDEWKTRNSKGRNYTFHAAFVDQGLLYHYVKYERKNVSIVHRHGLVENWGHDTLGNLQSEGEISGALEPHSKPLMEDKQSCWKWICDFVHFVGRSKPWNSAPTLDGERLQDPYHLWWHTFREVNSAYALELNLSNWTALGSPLLGYSSGPRQVKVRIQKAQKALFEKDKMEENTKNFSLPTELSPEKNRSVETMMQAKTSSKEEKNNTIAEVKQPEKNISVQNPFQANMSSVSTTATPAEYAYAFVIGGCDPKNPSYRGYIYNILVNAWLLREFNSKADVVALLQLKRSSGYTKLPPEDEEQLKALGVKIKYMSKIPENRKEDFYEFQNRKFDILNLTEYRRVIHMDGDVMVLGPLDYLFELSDGPNAVLKDNLIVSGTHEPSNGGFFMLSPGEGKLEHLRGIIQRRLDSYVDGRASFDIVKGWGHEIKPPDRWVHRRGSGTNWTFHAAFADQGLLYHFVKYEMYSVSIVMKDGFVENWGKDSDGSPLREHAIKNTFANYSKPLLFSRDSCSKWMCDYHHFTGRGKPWNRDPVVYGGRMDSPYHLWWHTFQRINTEVSLGLNLSDWVQPGRPSLGLYLTRVG